jgi:hypothetical protein
MVAPRTIKQRQKQDELKGLSRESLNLLLAVSLPKHYCGVTDWQERWRRGDYRFRESWKFAWGFLRHWWQYQEDWAFNVQRRQWADKGLIPPISTDMPEWERNYGLQYALDPALNAFDVANNPLRLVREQSQQVYRGPREATVVLLPNEAMVIMDLSRPIAPQLDAAKRHLPPRSRSSRRLRTDKYPKYICALDAKAAGASNAKIGRVLYPKLRPQSCKDQVKNDLRAAESLSWNGYRLLVRGR